MHDIVSIQPLENYGRNTNGVALLKPTETLTLILESGASYQYAVKLHTRVVNVTWVCDTALLLTVLNIDQCQIMGRFPMPHFPTFHGELESSA